MYYNALTSVEVITLYNALSSVLSLKQQAEIYKNKELFEKYNNILKEIEFKPLENINDYEWKQALDRESELQNNTSREIVSKVLQAFQGVEFDHAILDVQEENVEVKGEENKSPEILKDFKTDKELKGMVEKLITKRKDEAIIQNIVIKENPEIEVSKIKNEMDDKKKEIKEVFELRMKSLLDEKILQRIKFYITPDEDIFMSNCSEEFLKASDDSKEQEENSISVNNMNWNADRVVSILNIIQLAARKRRKDLKELDLLACANILNKLADENKPIQIYINKEWFEYLEILMNSISENLNKNRAEQLVRKLYSDKMELDEILLNKIVVNYFDSDKSETVKLIRTNVLKMFSDRDKEKEGEKELNIACYIDEGKNENSSWKTRRRNTLIGLIKILEDIYIEQKCNELLHDFGFINCIEILNCSSSKEDNKDGYKGIQNYINQKVKYFSEEKNHYLIQQGISFVKEQVIKEQEYYKIHEINLESLNTIIRKSDSTDIRKEAETMKQRLLAERKINTQIFDEFVERLEFYYKNRLDKDNSFHVNTLKMLCDKLINKDVPIDCAEKLIDIEKEERKRIYQLELNSYVRAYKNYLEQKEREEQEEKKLDKNAQNEPQEAQTANDETDN